MEHNEMFDFVELRFVNDNGYAIIVQLDSVTVKRVHQIATFEEGSMEYYSIKVAKATLPWLWIKPKALFKCSAFADGIEFELDYVELRCDPLGHISLAATAAKLTYDYHGFLEETRVYGTYGSVRRGYSVLGLKEPKFYYNPELA